MSIDLVYAVPEECIFALSMCLLLSLWSLLHSGSIQSIHSCLLRLEVMGGVHEMEGNFFFNLAVTKKLLGFIKWFCEYLAWYSQSHLRTSFVHYFGRGGPYLKFGHDILGYPFVVKTP
jgi:hypothetical protein